MRLPQGRRAFSRREAAGATWGAKWELEGPVLGDHPLHERQGLHRGSLGGGVRLRGDGGVRRHEGSCPGVPAPGRPREVRCAGWRGPHPAQRRRWVLTGYLSTPRSSTSSWPGSRSTSIHSGLFLLVLNAVLLVLGSVLEIYSAIIILAADGASSRRPTYPDPIHLGIMSPGEPRDGLLLPPVGPNLFLPPHDSTSPCRTPLPAGPPFLAILGSESCSSPTSPTCLWGS